MLVVIFLVVMGRQSNPGRCLEVGFEIAEGSPRMQHEIKVTEFLLYFRNLGGSFYYNVFYHLCFFYLQPFQALLGDIFYSHFGDLAFPLHVDETTKKEVKKVEKQRNTHISTHTNTHTQAFKVQKHVTKVEAVYSLRHS